METEVLRTEYFDGYEVRVESVRMTAKESPVVLLQAYTPEGGYIGSPQDAEYLITKRGIKPQPRLPENPDANGGRGRTCAIGYCEREGKWYGWSHRALAGFETQEEAEAFAESVS